MLGLPSHEDVAIAVQQGEEAVIALVDRLVSKIRELETRVRAGGAYQPRRPVQTQSQVSAQSRPKASHAKPVRAGSL